MTLVDHETECHMLLNKDGLKFTANERDQFVIEAQVEKEQHYILISPIILW